MADTFCALCGVPFGVPPGIYVEDDWQEDEDFLWMKPFHAVTRISQSSEWFLSDPVSEINDDGTATVPTPNAVDNASATASDGAQADRNFVAFSLRGTELNVGYPIHVPCLQLLNQCFLEVSHGPRLSPSLLGEFLSTQAISGCGRGLNTTWSDIGYGGAEQFWEDSSKWMEKFAEVEETEDIDYIDNIGRLAEWDFLVFDPTSMTSEYLEGLMADPPVLESAQRSSYLYRDVDTSDNDPFRKLSFELLEIILGLLPTVCVKNLRLASRAIVRHGLADAFWATRLDYPHELSYIPRKQVIESEARQLDWKRFRQMILDTEEESLYFLKRAEMPHRNRRRITNLALQFSKALLRFISKRDQTLEVWVDEYQTPRYSRKLMPSALLVTSRDSVEFSGVFEWKRVKKINVMYEQKRPNIDDYMVDGVEFHMTEDDDEHNDQKVAVIKRLGRRHGRFITGTHHMCDIEQGRILAGFAFETTEEGGFSGLVPVSRDTAGGGPIMVSKNHYRAKYATEFLVDSPDSTVVSVQAAFHGDWLVSLTLVEKKHTLK